MHQTRYLTFAGPALAVVATYGIMMLISTRRRLGMFLLIILLGLQIVGINWGFEEGHWGQGKSTLRSLASTIKISSLPSHIMVIGEGAGRGYPGALIYELEPHTMIAVLGSDSDLEALQSKVQDYDDIWIAFSTDSETVDIENDFLNRLQKSGHYTEIFRKQKVFRGQPAVHLRKVKHQ
jgi:hypothetical protein